VTTATSTEDQAAAVFAAAPYTRRLTPEPEGGYSASIHELPGCFAEGDSADDALTALEAAAKAWIAAAIETGRPVPRPVDVSEYSGKIALRMPRSLHRIAAERASMEGCSLNQLLVTAISHYLGQRDGFEASVGPKSFAALYMARRHVSARDWTALGAMAVKLNFQLRSSETTPNYRAVTLSSDRRLAAALPGQYTEIANA